MANISIWAQYLPWAVFAASAPAFFAFMTAVFPNRWHRLALGAVLVSGPFLFPFLPTPEKILLVIVSTSFIGVALADGPVAKYSRWILWLPSWIGSWRQDAQAIFLGTALGVAANAVFSNDVYRLHIWMVGSLMFSVILMASFTTLLQRRLLAFFAFVVRKEGRSHEFSFARLLGESDLEAFLLHSGFRPWNFKYLRERMMKMPFSQVSPANG